MATSNSDSSNIRPPTDPTGPTGLLSNWVRSIILSDIPAEVQERAKYLILDGLACLLVGAHLPWSEKATRTILSFESPGSGACNVFGWDGVKISPPSAALLNSSFIQGFELDDWHSEAPLHSNSLILPSLFAVSEQESTTSSIPTSGEDFLLAAIVGYEIGPRVGLALWGSHILSAGWHSGAVFGPAAVASACSKLLNLEPAVIEDALGIACTQASGLMSAQFGSDAKRMQHGFAARNGILGTLLARNGYSGIKKVFEEPYGGFLSQFSAGNGKTPNNLPDEIAKDLGKVWKTKNVRLKPYAAMAATHPTVDCIRVIQEQNSDLMSLDQLSKIKSIVIEMQAAAFHHGGWQATRPLTPVGAQMSCMYVAATQLVDSEVLVRQFAPDMLERDIIWDLVSKTSCVHNEDSSLDGTFAQRITIKFDVESGIQPVQGHVKSARGVDPELSNDEILDKWRHLTTDLIDAEQRETIEKLVLNLEGCEDMKTLGDQLVKIRAR